MTEDTRPLMVSVRCTVYNHEPYLRQCLDGFVMQKTNFRFEAIVHDDASTDGSAEIIKEYAKKYPNIIKPIYETENQWSKKDGSLARIMNEACKGKYVALCEGDDYWTDCNKLQKQVDYLEMHDDCSMVCSKASLFSETRNCIIGQKACYSQSQELVPQDVIIKGGLFIPTCSTVIRNEILDNYPDYCVKCHVGDFPRHIYCVMRGKGYYMNDAMSVYRVENPNSWVGRNLNAKTTAGRLADMLSEVLMLQGFKADYPQYSETFDERIFIYLRFNIPSRNKDAKGHKMFSNIFEEEIKSLNRRKRFAILLASSNFSFLLRYYERVEHFIQRHGFCVN